MSLAVLVKKKRKTNILPKASILVFCRISEKAKFNLLQPMLISLLSWTKDVRMPSNVLILMFCKLFYCFHSNNLSMQCFSPSFYWSLSPFIFLFFFVRLGTFCSIPPLHPTPPWQVFLGNGYSLQSHLGACKSEMRSLNSGSWTRSSRHSFSASGAGSGQSNQCYQVCSAVNDRRAELLTAFGAAPPVRG